MIPGYSKQTEDLTDKEKRIARIVYGYIVHSPRWISNAEIRDRLRREKMIKSSGPRIRKMINWMHLNGHLANLATSEKGYKIAQTKQELLDCKSALSSRIGAIQARLDQVENDLKLWDKQHSKQSELL